MRSTLAEGDAHRLTRAQRDHGPSLAEQIAARVDGLSYRTVFHSLRLRGRFPLKLQGAPRDPVAGDTERGQALVGGRLAFAGHMAPARPIAWRAPAPPAWAAYAHSFLWLRDLEAAAEPALAVRVTEPLLRSWLAEFDRYDPLAWAPDVIGTRIFAWAAHAPLVIHASDLVLRSAALNAMARWSRHLDRTWTKAPPGLARLRAAAGVVTAGLVLPGPEGRLARGEEALAAALAGFTGADGGVATRAPHDALEVIELLMQVEAAYAARGRPAAVAVREAGARLRGALAALTLGDGRPSVWHGTGLLDSGRVERALRGAAPARPQAGESALAYQRLEGGPVALVLDAGPPPDARISTAAHASTLAFEMSDGTTRVIVNCGGARGLARPLPPELAALLRTTAAHSTLVVADTNSTRIRDDGRLGRGVVTVTVRRDSAGGGQIVEASHDGYRRRFGLDHRRRLYLSGDGSDLRGEDALVPARRDAGGATRFDVRFHLGPEVLPELAGDGHGATLNLPGGRRWRFLARGGGLAVEESLWVDETGKPHATHQLVISGEGAAEVSWTCKRIA